jgi:hypothetical protein
MLQSVLSRPAPKYNVVVRATTITSAVMIKAVHSGVLKGYNICLSVSCSALGCLMYTANL